MDKDISASESIMTLGTNCNLERIAALYMNSLIWSYMDQIFDPDNWQVISFHNRAGTRLDPSVKDAYPQILKPLGVIFTNLVVSARRQEHIHFSNVILSVNFQPITGSDEIYSIYTFTELPNVQETVHNDNENSVVLNTFLRNDDLRTYTKAQFQADVLDITRQKIPADIMGAQFGRNAVALDVSRKDALFRKIIPEAEFRFIENQLLTNFCPGISYRPSSVINRVKQVITDSMHVTHLSIRNYFINIIIAMNWMGGKYYKLDVVWYTVENMDPDIVGEMESSYVGHLGQRARDSVTQTLDIQQLLIHATNAEKKVNNTRNIISSRTTKILSVIPGFADAATTVATADGQVVPSLASVAENTIQNNTTLPEFTRVHARCLGCNSQSHM